MHNAITYTWRAALVIAAAVAVRPSPTAAEGQTHPTAEPRDGQHDFDFELGKWKMHLRKLKNPLHGSKEWIEFSGTSVTCAIPVR